MNERIIWVQECPSSIVRRQVNKSIDDQWEQLSARALKPHDPQCEEPTFCTKMHCFEWQPDKIVSDSYQIEYIKRMK